MSKRPDLSALADAAGSVRVPRAAIIPAPTPASITERPARAPVAPSRVGMKPITGFYPEEVRAQLKILGIKQRRSMESMLAEGLNDLFAKYGEPEIAPVDRAT